MSFSSVRLVNQCWKRLCSSRPVSWIACVLLVLPLSFASSEENARPADPKPFVVIDIASTGYPLLSRTERLAGDANVTLDFVDDNHVLLTFNPKKLFQRHPDCPPSHDDRLIRAVILEVPSGKVVQTADWYLHDHRRYLWPMGSGNFWCGG